MYCMLSEFTTFALCVRRCMALRGAVHGRGAHRGAPAAFAVCSRHGGAELRRCVLPAVLSAIVKSAAQYARETMPFAEAFTCGNALADPLILGQHSGTHAGHGSSSEPQGRAHAADPLSLQTFSFFYPPIGRITWRQKSIFQAVPMRNGHFVHTTRPIDGNMNEKCPASQTVVNCEKSSNIIILSVSLLQKITWCSVVWCGVGVSWSGVVWRVRGWVVMPSSSISVVVVLFRSLRVGSGAAFAFGVVLLLPSLR